MTTITVASGKGGAGKTSISAALSSLLAPACVFADCDVDAANGAIALGATIRERHQYDAGPGFRIDASTCLSCGACVALCRFKAIKANPSGQGYRIAEDLCERCGACVPSCPAGAITTFEKTAGELLISDSRLGISIVHAELIPGEDTSGKLVAVVRERAGKIAKPRDYIVVDAPPGIGCPVIASFTRADWVLLVIEASVSGIRDARRLAELLRQSNRRAVALINKSGLDQEQDERSRQLASDFGLPLAGEIPFEPALRGAEEVGKTWLDMDCPASAQTRKALKDFITIIQEENPIKENA